MKPTAPFGDKFSVFATTPVVAYLFLVRSMRALVAAVGILVTVSALAAEHHFISPNGEFEAYTIAANDDRTGMKLFLRRANSPDAGVLLRQNNRWIDAKWSPDSRFLAVIDHLDGHMSDVYVFGITGSDAVPTLLYHTPDLHTYDMKWDVTGWDVSRRQVVLDKEVKQEMPGKITHEKIVARIGTDPLKLEENE
jgi:hypothetical protein